METYKTSIEQLIRIINTGLGKEVIGTKEEVVNGMYRTTYYIIGNGLILFSCGLNDASVLMDEDTMNIYYKQILRDLVHKLLFDPANEHAIRTKIQNNLINQ